jgi:hypothetical protein
MPQTLSGEKVMAVYKSALNWIANGKKLVAASNMDAVSHWL